MLSYNGCLCLAPINKFREEGLFSFFHGFRRKQSHGFASLGYKFNPKTVKCYGRYDYEDDEDDDIAYADFDSDGYCSSDDLVPEELNNLNSQNAKSVEKASVARSPRALTATGPACPERELNHRKGDANVLTERSLTRNGTPRADSSVLQPSSFYLSQKEWEKRAAEIIQQQTLRRIVMKKREAEQKTMLKPSKPEDFSPLMGSIAMKKNKAEQTIMLDSSKSKDVYTLTESIAVEKKRAKQKIMLKLSESKDVDPLAESLAMEKKKAEQKITHKSSKSKDVDPFTESIAMEKEKGEHKSVLKSSKSENADPLMENNAMEKKKTKEKIMIMASKVKDVTGRSMVIRSTSAILHEEVKVERIEDIRYHQKRRQLEGEARCETLVQYLSNMGFREVDLVRIYDRHKPALCIKVEAVQKRMDFLVGMGVKSEDLVKIITRHPQILEYSIDGKIKSHIEFLLGLGVPASRLGRILTAAPSLLSCSLELSLKPKVRFLTEEVGIERKKLGKIVVLSPHILIQRIEDSMKSRLDFLSKEVGASKESLVKMVTKHPQLLHYNIEDGMKPRIEFLRSIGMSNADIVKVLTRLTQILSLSVEKSLRPKYLYLVNELNCGVQSLMANPAYFSLSLEQRIWARHRFLAALKKVPSGPFPLTALLVADDSFCKRWANSPLEAYEAFRKELILNKLKRQLLQKYGSRS